VKNVKILWILFILGYSLSAASQQRPPINVFYPEDYGANAQNWSISQSNERYIYSANNKGLLEFNGAKWNLYRAPNQINIYFNLWTAFIFIIKRKTPIVLLSLQQKFLNYLK